jgi:hypothetical protein
MEGNIKGISYAGKVLRLGENGLAPLIKMLDKGIAKIGFRHKRRRYKLKSHARDPLYYLIYRQTYNVYAKA